MSAGILRVHGAAAPQTLTGGYQFKFFTVHDTAGSAINFATGANATSSTQAVAYTVAGSVFEGAVRAIEEVASIVVLGTPTSAGFTVAVDGATFAGRDDKTGYVDNSTATLATLIGNYIGSTSIYVGQVSLSGITLA